MNLLKSLKESERLIEEVPTYSNTEHSLVHRIMRSEEVVLVALSCIDVAHHYEETGVLDVNVGVNIDDRIVAYLYVVLAVALYRILSHIR